MFTETHAHLDFPAFAPDFKEVLARAEDAGVARIVCIGTTLEGSRSALALAEAHPNIYAVVGVHPNSTMEAEAGDLEAIRELARNPRVVAIGEAGLDYFRLSQQQDQETLEKVAAIKSRQAEYFRRQLDLAVELGLNIVVHERSAWEDTLAILREYTGRLKAVFHCFGKSYAHAQEVLALGHLVSFTGIVTFKNAPEAQEAATKVPAGSFMLETDCPFLAPVPHRGGRAEPAYVRHIAEHIAGLRGVSIAQLSDETEKTANGFFRFVAAR